MKCSDCAVDLATVEQKGMHIATCGQCSGMWLTQSIVASLVPSLDAEGAAALANAAGSARNCPACGINMNLIAYKDVELDFCGACHGVWFDKDELASAMAQRRKGRHAAIAATAALAVGAAAAAAVAVSAEHDPTGRIADRVSGFVGDAGSSIISAVDLGDVVAFVGSLLCDVITGILD